MVGGDLAAVPFKMYGGEKCEIRFGLGKAFSRKRLLLPLRSSRFQDDVCIICYMKVVWDDI